jgi:4'-phosphopantetheinyl transferase
MSAEWTPSWTPMEAGTLTLGEQCHLWRVDLDDPRLCAQGDAALDDPERERAARFRFMEDRARYVSGRAALRTLLGRYLAMSPRDVPIVIAEKGRPSLAPPLAMQLDFNVSHSAGAAVICVARARPLGVDIELLGTQRDFLSLARRVFTPAEIARLQSAARAQLEADFLTCWTRKEAVLKCTGHGLTVEPASIHVGTQRSDERVDFDVFGERWSARVVSFWVRPDVIGACALPPRGQWIRCFDFMP